ncbi:MAG: alpha-galactosidase [Clostridia bacterium]|nr:alpha-galactosidase [Clostridia bacterium]
MNSFSFEDCYVRWEEPRVYIGNSAMERCLELSGGILITLWISDKRNGYCWKGRKPTVCAEKVQKANFCVKTDNDNGLSGTYLSVSLTCEGDFRSVRHELRIFPKIPFVKMKRFIRGKRFVDINADTAEHDGIETGYAMDIYKNAPLAQDNVCDLIPLPDAHLKVECVKLFDRTDGYDTLTKSDVQQVYGRGLYRSEGDIAIVNDYLKGEALMTVKEAPTHLSSIGHNGEDFRIGNGYLSVIGTGIDDSIPDDEELELYGTVVGVGNTEEIYDAYKGFEYNARHGGAFVMSNTWGDRHQDSAVCHSFMMCEIERAYKLGVDIVQIDDGWQKGITANSALASGGVWSGYYDKDDSFWTVNQTKFPEGLSPLVSYAAEKGIELGLWFSPDSSRNFANWRRDAATICELSRAHGIRHFKLDGVNLPTRLAERNFIRMMRSANQSSGGRIRFNLDVTAQQRLGYICGKEFGTLFVENRYTDWKNYYPHNTLKNLWSLSRFFPTTQFQFELLNNKRNIEKYGDDIFAPSKYSMDYLFACTMLSNPLVWMEMSALQDGDVEVLSKIIAVYRKHRTVISESGVTPIGAQPDGMSFCGFQVKHPSGVGYLLLFRESTPEDTGRFRISLPFDSEKSRILYTNAVGENSIWAEEGCVVWRCKAPRSFVFIEIN